MTAAGVTLVTGASAPYARTLWQFLRSAERHLRPCPRLVVFDLGLEPAWRTRLARRFPSVLWREPAFAALPAHARPSARTYAWKPAVIHAAAAEFGGLVVWLDSATVCTGPIDALLAGIARDGVFTLAGQSALQDRCDPAVWSAFGAPLEHLDRPERPAGVIGFDLARPAARALLDDWRAAVDRPELWRPLDRRHRPEQALLSLLLYRYADAGRLTVGTEPIDISCAAPVRWLSTRNKVSNRVPVAADPLVRAGYAAAKAADRLALRAKDWWRRRAGGFHRRTREHYRLWLAPADGPARPLPDSAAGYYADPFLIRHEGLRWLFAEEFSYAANEGRLVALPLDKDLRPGSPVRLDLPQGHLSFPFLCPAAGALWLIPESSARRTLDLYECVRFPDRWRLRRRLFADLDAADSVLLRHAGRWWLFTSVRDRPGQPGRALQVFHTDDPLAGTWIAHPVNAARLYADAPYGTGRCAGAPFTDAAGRLVRPMHASARHYGEGLRLRHVVTLTPEQFEETDYTGDHPAQRVLAARSPHHLVCADDLVVWDERDRFSLRSWFFPPAAQSLPSGPQNTAAPASSPAAPDRPRG